MLVVRGIEVKTGIVCAERLEIELRASLFSRTSISIRLEHRVPSVWKLILYDREGNIYSISRGDRIRFSKPVIAYRACPGNTSLYIQRHGDTVLIKRFVELCGRQANSDGFCTKHRGSEYQRYISYVFGLRKPDLDTSLMRIPHMIYALHIGGSSVKIGIANGIKNTDRLYEQVFLHATVLAFVENGVEARRIEDHIRKVGKVSDRAVLRHRLQWFRVDSLDLDAQLREYVRVLVGSLIPSLKAMGITSSLGKMIPVIRFDVKYIDLVRRSAIVSDESQLNSLEGEFEVVDYAVGGIVLDQEGKRFFVPYSLIRDRALRIHIPT